MVGRPLEPDAGNADEGRSDPDWHLSHAFSAHGFFDLWASKGNAPL
jgi:hypothetical protein